MKRTFIFSLVLLLVVLISAAATTDSFAFNPALKAALSPNFSITVLNGSTPVPGAKVTITGPHGTVQQNSDSNGQVCIGYFFGMVRVTFTANGGLSGCKDINHQSQTMCATNPYTISNGNLCND